MHLDTTMHCLPYLGMLHVIVEVSQIGTIRPSNPDKVIFRAGATAIECDLIGYSTVSRVHL
jgi:hypothetical protein